ncbi:Hypothetical predicted protein [Mytilus galloprovincialis]|uniref:Uncharacterized protein n=1 Tax=Mytilus galloprovincialis TaxID=29158 RepID=A0A8B6GJ42_MYTGA|nr:Hypothetical predicted protein [Mytilus galloprovincialis]
MRQATNFVLKECTNSGLNILNLSTDGQWIQLMNRDTSGKALTIFQLQKDVWNSTKSMSKQELLKQLVNIFDNYQDRGICVKKLSSGAVSVSSKDEVMMNIRTPAYQTIMNKEQIGDCVEENVDDTTGSRSTDWLPDSVINILPDNSDSDLLRDVDKVSNEITDVCLADNVNEANTTEAESEHAKQTDVEHTIEVQSDNLNDIMDTSGESETTRIDIEQQRSTATNIELTEEILKKLVTSLKQNPKTASKWTNVTHEQLRTKLTSYLTIRSLRHPDLEVLHETCKNEIPSLSLEFRKNWKKDDKVGYVCTMFGVEVPSTVSTKPSQSRTRTEPKNPLPLKTLSKRMIQTKAYPKANLRIGYSAYLFEKKVREWQNESPFPCPAKIEGICEDIKYWFSYQEKSTMTKRLLTKSIDCSHNLTHLRVRTSRKGICGVSSVAWHKCAKSNETRLTLPFVEDLIDKQSVANARTHFSQEVEDWMKKNEYKKASDLTRLIRNWYEASDNPGIPAAQRIRFLVEMRNFLLKDLDFSKFPPYTRYFKGIPCVTFEGMMIDIDSKIQLHTMANGYNIRSVGSLAAETTVGVLQAMYPTSQVSIKARDVPELISSVVEVMTCKSNPDRGFWMKTSRSSGIYPDHEADMTTQKLSDKQQTTINGIIIPRGFSMKPLQSSGIYPDHEIDFTAQTISDIQTTSNQCIITPRDHAFDLPARGTRKRRIKIGEISGPMAPARGALSVRQYNRKDESKILPTKRYGMDLKEI